MKSEGHEPEGARIEVVEPRTDAEILGAFDVVHQLRPHLKRGEFVDQVRRQEMQGYRLVILQVAGQVCAVAGFRLTESLSAGPHIYVDDLVTDSDGRSRGYGAVLLNWLADLGRRSGYRSLHLDSGVQRHAAHRFYFREGLKIVFYHFSREL